jgi:hypothetical protein
VKSPPVNCVRRPARALSANRGDRVQFQNVEGAGSLSDFRNYGVHIADLDQARAVSRAIVQAMDGAPASVRGTFRVEVIAAQDNDTWALKFLADGRPVHDERLDAPDAHAPDYIRSRVQSFLDSLDDMPGPELVEAIVEELVGLPWSHDIDSDSRDAIRRVCGCSEAKAAAILTEVYAIKRLLRAASDSGGVLTDAPIPSGCWKWERAPATRKAE